MGLGGFVSAAFRRLRTFVVRPFRFLSGIRQLKAARFTTVFVHEGDVAVRLPQASGRDVLTARGRQLVSRCHQFHGRPEAEVLLRRLIYTMYREGLLDPRRSIIDIGSWLADNTLVWATFLRGDAVVYAIDPDPGNIQFGTSLAVANAIGNIRWSECVCSDVPGVRLSYEGSLAMASFNEKGEGRDFALVTTTLDEIVGTAQWGNIGLLHVDVEGFEWKVLAGARDIIAASRPVILFEQHICLEDIAPIMQLLQPLEYEVYMVNEMMVENNLDCRNFMAVPAGMDLSVLMKVETFRGRAEGIWYAVPGDALIPVR